MTNKAKDSKLPSANPNQIPIVCKPGEDPQVTEARALYGPSITNAYVASLLTKELLGPSPSLPSLITVFADNAKRVHANDMTDVEATLVSQATTLNIMFGELSRRAAANLGEYLDASERYFRLAMKAQNQCRMTLETLSNIKNPPVIYARQANFANGPQQVNNHAHAGENNNQPNKVLERGNEQRLDGGTQSQAVGSDTELATVAAGNGASNG